MSEATTDIYEINYLEIGSFSHVFSWIVEWSVACSVNSLAATSACRVECLVTDSNIEPQVFIDAQPSVEIKRINS